MAVVSKRRMQQQQQWSNRLKVGRVLLTVLSLFILAILLFRYDRQKNDTHYRKQLSSVSSSSSSYRSEPYLSPNHLLFFSSSSKKDAGGGGGAQLRGAAAKIETTETEETKVHEKQQSEKEEEEEQPHDKDESEGNNEETQEKKDIERKVIDNIIPQQEQLLPRPLKQEQPQPKQHNSSYRRIKLVLSNLKSSSTDSKTTTTTTTTEGEIIFELHPEWAPIGVERVRTLLERHFYDQARFFRVLPKFVVQFGIAADPHVQKQWQHATLRDDDEEPNENADPDKNAVRIGNVRGTVTFAKTGKNSRTTQLFINTGNNSYLDRQGFAPIGTIVAGMEYVDRIQDEYREQPQQHLIVTHGNAYLQEHFPHLSYISSVQIMHDDDPLSEKESLSIVDPVM
jgi:cyclophilin family peptidyl-prolyl cis-trans isomerase